jgi:alpha-glucosidase
MLQRCCLILGVVLILPSPQSPAQGTSPVTQSSPDGQIVLTLKLLPQAGGDADRGKLVYSVSFHQRLVMEDSALALELEGAKTLGSDVQITGADRGQGDDHYTLQFQKTGAVDDSYRSLIVHVAEPGDEHRRMDIEARVYNGGIGFRYLLPQQEALTGLHLKQEDTEFRLSTDATDWLLALPNYRSSYESEYVKLPTSALSNQGGVPSSFLIGLPLLMHEPSTAWLALMEAGIEGSTTMYVTNPSGNWAGHWFESRLSPSLDHPQNAVEDPLPYHSAWRVLLIADDPGRLVESTIQYDLNPPSRVDDTNWIHAGKASWNWWVNDVDENGNPSFTTENMKRYVDFAAASGLRYMMLDAGWSGRDLTHLNGKVDVPELARYAASKHVGLWVWCYSEAVMNQMKEAFPVFEKWGVVGIKIDFINRDDQRGVQFYYDTAREAAAHHLMVDFHGTRTPWGLERTYPNVMSYEGVLGLENDKVGRRDSPVDRSVFPFTRLLAGPMDYTPGAFRNTTEDGFVARNTSPMVMGTRAQQLALYVIFQTPIQMVSDSPQSYANAPGFQFIKDVPADWDGTRVLNGVPGEYVTIARRHGPDWYLGSMTNWTPRKLDVALDFLPDGVFTAEIYADGADAATQPQQILVRRQTVRRTQHLALNLAPGGGCAIRFVPVGRR